jgi:hypothetical protein
VRVPGARHRGKGRRIARGERIIRGYVNDIFLLAHQGLHKKKVVAELTEMFAYCQLIGDPVFRPDRRAKGISLCGRPREKAAKLEVGFYAKRRESLPGLPFIGLLLPPLLLVFFVALLLVFLDRSFLADFACPAQKMRGPTGGGVSFV